MNQDDPFARIYIPPIQPAVPPVRAEELSPASVLDRVSAGATGGDDGTPESAAISVVGTDGKLNLVPKHSTWATPSTYPTALRVVYVNGGVTLTIYIDGTEGIKVLDSASGDYTKISPVGVVTVYNFANGKSITISPTSLADNIAIDSAGIKVVNHTSGDYVQLGIDGKVTVYNATNTKSIVVSPYLLADNIAIDSAGIKVVNYTSGDYVQLGIDGKLTVYDSSGAKSAVIDPSLITQNMTVRAIAVCDSGTPKSMLVLGSAPYT